MNMRLSDITLENTAKKIVRRLHLAGIIKASHVSQARGMTLQALREPMSGRRNEYEVVTNTSPFAEDLGVVEADDLPLCFRCGSSSDVKEIRLRVEGTASRYQSKVNACCNLCRRKLRGKWKGIS
jgi:hypothetical protein